MFKTIALAALLSVSGLMLHAAHADEVWNTNTGKITYDSEQGSVAVWTYGTGTEAGVIYVLGLAKVYTHRGRYDGYWAQTTAKQKCDSERVGVDGAMTPYWGRFQIRFLDKNFPSRWEAVWSYCDGSAQANKIIATPAQP
ncbi:hypothetical protein [Thiofilum flexile]|uniref:hypothetical protein n=1 Tax=Thiofilum flexile TaxID=125627 RepID=UPI00036003D4|nr:hypothetical protein [Thiofilum flexile]